MGFKRDLFIVKLKKKFENIEYPEIVELIPETQKILFSKLWNQFQSLTEIIDDKNTENLVNTLQKDKTFTDDMTNFYGFYRFKDCLQQILRQNFFDTILIIQNVYSPRGINLFNVLEREQIVNISISENSHDENNSSIPHKDGEVVFDRQITNVNAEDLISEDDWNQEDPMELKYLRTKIVNMKEESIDPIQDPR